MSKKELDLIAKNEAFIEVPASKQSISMRGFVYGAGVNDSDYITKLQVDGKTLMCPFYIKWRNMIERCYSDKFQKIQPTYKGCSVCKEWLIFSSFKSWMIKQDWQDKQLDKDILIQGNKTYSPETCLFVTRQVNMLLNDSERHRGDFSLGVVYDKSLGKLKATCRDANGKSKHLGVFDSESKAHETYKEFKYSVIKSIANKQDEPLRSALLNHKIRAYNEHQ